MYSLKKDLSEITRRITSAPSRMKIALKTKDDHLFLERWVTHHSNIAGRHNIMIFDNEFTDPSVARFYQDNNDLLVISFSGFHNNLHMPKLFPDLYSAIWQSCDIYTFLDSDEYLILVENERYISNEHIVSKLLNDLDTPVHPGVWIYNSYFSEDIFTCGSTFGHLSSGIKWGKPVINVTKVPLRGVEDCILMHNCQLPSTLYQFTRPQCFILHLANLSPAERINANIRKLVARNFAQKSDGIDAILSRDITSVTDKRLLEYLDEIRVLRGLNRDFVANVLAPETMRLHDGSISFFGSAERNNFLSFINDFSIIQSILR